MNETGKIQISKGFRLQYEKAQQSYVLLFPEGLVKLNDPSVEILKLCDGQFDQDEIVTHLKQKFPQDDVEQDVKDFLNVALEKGWISVT